YAWGNGLRTEAELTYRTAEIDGISGTGAGPAQTGDMNVLSPMFNLIWDAYYISDVLTPYVGAGVGFAQFDADNIRQAINGSTINGSEGTFAYQAIVGLAWNIDRNWAMTADYRYHAALDTTFDTQALGVGARQDYASHNFMLGVRYTWAEDDVLPPPLAPAPVTAAAPQAAPEPPPPAPQPQPQIPPAPQRYIVFFDFDRSNLTPEAQRILATVASDYKSGRAVQIHVSGHADRSGRDGYNMRLSSRRADVVKAELERLGVPMDQVMTRASGERENLVPTADGVREAQNRRAEIVLGDGGMAR
ncbi:MAG: OmpA family protein, partial [Alphaproteobacteria bacterium]|nr:OmpA family protein [Alphaproteobacteria bacterium]